MKTRTNSGKNVIIFILSIIMVCTCVCCNAQKLDSKVIQAYKLRMNGQADSAQVILEEVIKDKPNNAAAWFELARTKQHIGLGNPRELFSGMKDIQQFAQNAVDNVPDNVIYHYYKANVDFFVLYIAMRNENYSDEFNKTAESFKSVLALKPDYHEAKLALIEMYAMIPPEMGGDPVIAEKYVQELEAEDIVYGARGREIIMPKDADHVAFWETIVDKQPNNAEVYESLGKAYLYSNNDETAIKAFEKAISLDAEKNVLHIVLGKYNQMLAMKGGDNIDLLVPKIEDEFNKYLKSKPEPIIPMKAYVKGQLAMIKSRTGDQENGKKLEEEAKALDPNYSKAFGVPGQILFDPPDKICRVYTPFFRPL